MEEIDNYEGCMSQIYQASHQLFHMLIQYKTKGIYTSLNERTSAFLEKEYQISDEKKFTFLKYCNKINIILKQYSAKLNMIEQQETNEYQELKKEIDEIKETLQTRMDSLKEQELICNSDEPTFLFKDYSPSKGFTLDLIRKYPGSYLYKEYLSDRRTANGDIYIDHDGTYEDIIAKYMNNDPQLYSLLDVMSIEEKMAIMDELEWYVLPIKKKFIDKLYYSEANVIMDAWKNRRTIMVNGKNVSKLNDVLKKKNLLESAFLNQQLKNILYFKKTNIIYLKLNMKYLDIIQDYLKNDRRIQSKDILQKCKNIYDYKGFLNELMMIGIDITDDDIKTIQHYFYQSYFAHLSKIIDNCEYDAKLVEWVQTHKKWKLVYRASEHGYTAESFHQCCDEITQPTLIVMKSTKGWIFGGYTTQSWKSPYTYDKCMNL